MNLQMNEVDLSIRNKRTPQPDVKSDNVVPRRRKQQNATPRRRTINAAPKQRKIAIKENN
jgi:hypothetical protein